MTRIAALATLLLASSASMSMAAEILVHDEKSSPESMTVAPDGTVIAGSASSPFIYAVKKGATTASVFVDATDQGPGTTFLGQLADGATNTLWTCQLAPGATPGTRRSFLRGFDLTTAKEKLKWQLPGETSLCNDIAIGPDKALYISDTLGGKIYRLKAGATAGELFSDAQTLRGIDGLTFLDGILYVNNVSFNKLYRISVDASGKPGAPVDIWMDAPVRGPDGMRAAGGKLFLAENQLGTVAALTITGDTAHVTPLKTGLNSPTAIEPFGDTLWFSERGAGKVESIPMPK